MLFSGSRPLIAVWAAFLVSWGACSAEFVPSEQGFDGAVAIVDSGEEDGVSYVTAKIPYRDIHGEPKEGLGRLYVRSRDVGKTLPAFVHVHYEKNLGSAKRWCNRGWAVASSHYDGEHPLDVSVGDSNNLQRALIQWVRRLPIIDRSRLHIDGGSQGGYMALAMAADFFPVTAVTADMPVVNWAYNLNYFEVNKPLTGFGKMTVQESPVPVMAMVSELASERMMSSPVPGCYGVFGSDLAADAWYNVSPISFVDRITAPVLTFTATGDMLVPHEQFTGAYPRPFDAALFPDGFQRDFDSLTRNDMARITLVEKLGPDKVSVHREPLPDGIYEYTRGNMVAGEPEPKGGMKDTERWWDPGKQWSLVVLDEGAPLPHSPHSRYHWKTSPDTFVAHYKDAVPSLDLLSSALFDRLIERYRGALSHAPLLPSGEPVNRTNYPLLEQLDVVQGLLDFAALGPAHDNRVSEYAAAKGLGQFVAADAPQQLTLIRDQLREQLGLPAIP